MKRFLKYFLYSMFLIIFFDVVIFRHILGFGIPIVERYGFTTNYRMPTPYVNFVGDWLLQGKTSYDKVDFFGDKDISDEEKEKSIKVAFFGGSTGVPISERYFEEKLQELWGGVPVIVKNFSCASLHHRHHLHMILEFLPKYNPDIIIFYGGVNEGSQHLEYDPRPGYPYNFYYRGETPTLNKFLIEHSGIFSVLEQRFSILTNYKKLREEYKPATEEWGNDIVNKYFETLQLSKTVSETLKSKYWGHTRFIAFYQPYRLDMVPEFKREHEKIRERIKDKDYVFDIHDTFDIFDDSIWDENDYCHVGFDENSPQNKHLVNVMAEITAKNFPFKPTKN